MNQKYHQALKARFEKYFQNVPTELWFVGRKDAPSPSRQIYAVEKMFGIDCIKFGGADTPFDYFGDERFLKRALRVAESRLEQWERQQALLERRAKLASLVKNQL